MCNTKKENITTLLLTCFINQSKGSFSIFFALKWKTKTFRPHLKFFKINVFIVISIQDFKHGMDINLKKIRGKKKRNKTNEQMPKNKCQQQKTNSLLLQRTIAPPLCWVLDHQIHSIRPWRPPIVVLVPFHPNSNVRPSNQRLMVQQQWRLVNSKRPNETCTW